MTTPPRPSGAGDFVDLVVRNTDGQFGVAPSGFDIVYQGT